MSRLLILQIRGHLDSQERVIDEFIIPLIPCIISHLRSSNKRNMIMYNSGQPQLGLSHFFIL